MNKVRIPIYDVIISEYNPWKLFTIFIDCSDNDFLVSGYDELRERAEIILNCV